MRTFSFILTLGFVVAGSSLAGTSEGNLPGVGAFSFNGPVAPSAPAVMVAGLTVARRS